MAVSVRAALLADCFEGEIIGCAGGLLAACVRAAFLTGLSSARSLSFDKRSDRRRGGSSLGLGVEKVIFFRRGFGTRGGSTLVGTAASPFAGCCESDALAGTSASLSAFFAATESGFFLTRLNRNPSSSSS